MALSMPTPVVDPTFPPNTPANIIRAYTANRNCTCNTDDVACSNCLVVLPGYLMESRDASAIGAIIAVPIIAAVIVFLRTYSRIFIVKKIGKDDILAILGLALYIPFQVLSIILIHLGSGRHLEYIQFVVAQNHHVLNQTEVLDFIAHIIYTTALFVCRLSGIAFYLRLLDRSKGWTVLLCKISALLLFLGFIPQIVLLIVHCSPVTGLWPYGWQKEANDYTCLAWGAVYSANSGISLVCDFLLFGTAVTLLAGWNINKRDKFYLTPILLPGGLYVLKPIPGKLGTEFANCSSVIGISIVRLYLVVQGQWEADQSWWYDPMLVIENAEIGSTLIALCMPGLKPLFVKFHNKHHPSYWYSSKRGRSLTYRPTGQWRDEGSCRSLRELRKISHNDSDTIESHNYEASSSKMMASTRESAKDSSMSNEVYEHDFPI